MPAYSVAWSRQWMPLRKTRCKIPASAKKPIWTGGANMRGRAAQGTTMAMGKEMR
ncbi:MAG: hypothetical protein FWC42_02170 [Proteobacteria bacterium]|nr:hypothetical protein [Pseudomonadota bacterium]